MRRIVLTAAFLGLTGLAWAQTESTVPTETDDDECTAPMAVWQPREALEAKLVSEGWTVLRITVDDGCYEVDAVDPKGVNVEAEFDPETFRLVELEIED
jgi:hypothetical protein